MKPPFQNKRLGFYFTLATSAFFLLVALIYFLIYRGTNELNIGACVALIVSAVIAIGVSFIPKWGRFSRFFLLVGGAIGTSFWAYGIYYYVSVVIADIDLHGYSAEFIATAILFGLSIILPIANLFLPFEKEESKAFRPLRIVLTSLFCLMGTAAPLSMAAEKIALENEGYINLQLGIDPYVKEKGQSALSTDYFESDYQDIASLRKDGEQLASDIEEEGAVLLKNENNALPLSQGDHVSLFSLSSVDPAYGGEGSSAATRPAAPTSLIEALQEEGIESNPTLAEWYLSRKSTYAPTGYQIKDAPWSALSAGTGVVESFQSYGDAAIFVIKRIRGENTDVAYSDASCDGDNGNYLALNANEKSVLSALSEQKGSTFGKLIVLLNSPNPMEMDFLRQYDIDACLWIGSVGQTGFKGVARILSGAASPSGKLSDTFYYRHQDNPVMANWGSFTYANYMDYLSELPSFGGKSYSSMQYASYVAYQEGIYVGYRYSETRYEDCVSGRDLAGEFDYTNTIAYPFGYGLSYTHFKYSESTYAYDSAKGIHSLTLHVENDGQASGKESVQLYLQKPYSDYDTENHIEKSSLDLVDYAKTGLLAPGESETLHFEVKDEDFASYDAYGHGCYFTEASSDYRLIFGSSSHDAINNALADKGYSVSDGMDANGNASLVKRVSQEETVYSSGAKNLFGSMDINRSKMAGTNKIEYMSRADWIDTIPSSNVVLNLTDEMMKDLLAQNSDFEQDNLPYPTYGKQNGLNLIDLRVDAEGNPIELDNPIWDDLLDELTYEDTAKLLVTGLRKTTGIESVAKPSTVDHNGPTGLVLPYGQGNGLAMMMGDPGGDYSPPYYPCLGILASTFSKALAEKMGQMLGEDALWAGFSGFYGVGLNTHRSAYDGRAFEYYSEDGVLAGMQAACLTKGLQSKGCNAYVKHIAGYEQQNNRVGLSVWCSEQAYREIYLRPFKLAVKEGGAMNAMTSYTRLGTRLCPASEALLEGFLREECGMKGLIVSDMWTGRYLNSQLPHCINAGMSLTDSDLDVSILDRYKDGFGGLAQRMRDAAKHILYATLHSNAMNGIGSDTVFRYVAPAWKGAIASGRTSALIAFAIISAGTIAIEAIALFRKKDKEPFMQGGNQ